MLPLHPTNVKKPLSINHRAVLEAAEKSRKTSSRPSEREYWQHYQYGVLDQCWNRLDEKWIQKLHSSNPQDAARARGYYDGINWQHRELQLGLPEANDVVLEYFLRRAA